MLPYPTGAIKTEHLTLTETDANYGDQSQIKYLISTGKSQWDATERYIDGL
jgi:hypothetical protein